MNRGKNLKRAGLAAAVVIMAAGLSACGKTGRGGEVVKLADISGYEYTPYTGVISDSDVKDYFLETVENYATHGYMSYEPDTDRDGSKVKKGDILNIDFVTSVDGTPVDNGSASSFILEVGAGKIIKELDDQLVGLTVGKKSEIKASLPADYEVAELAGKNITFEVTVNSVMNEVPFTAENAHYYFKYQDTDSLLKYIGGYLEENADMYESYKADYDKRQFVEYVVDNSEFGNISSEVTNRNHCTAEYIRDDVRQGSFTNSDYAETKGFKTVESYLEYCKERNEKDVMEELAFAELAKEKGYKLSGDEYDMYCYKQAVINGYFVSTNESGADVEKTVEMYRDKYEQQHGEGTFDAHINTMYYEEKAFEEISGN